MYFPISALNRYNFQTLGTDNWSPIGGNNGNNWQTTESSAVQTVPIAMQLTNFYAQTGPTGVGQSVVYTVRKNGVDTALTLTLDNNNLTGLNTATVKFAAGDTICIRATTTSQVISPSFHFFSFLGIATGQVIFASDCGNGSSSNSAVTYGNPFGGGGDWVASTPAESPFTALAACPGVISNFNFDCPTAPGGAASWTMLLRQNAANTAITAAVSGATTHAVDNTHTVTVAAGDRMAFQVTPAGTPAANGYLHRSFVFTPTNAGDCWYGMSADPGGYTSLQMAEPIGTGWLYGLIYGTGNETNAMMQLYPGYFKSLYANLDAAPGGATATKVSFRKNGADTALVCTISGAATSANSTGQKVPVSLGDRCSIGFTPTGAPASANANVGLCFNMVQGHGFYQPF